MLPGEEMVLFVQFVHVVANEEDEYVPAGQIWHMPDWSPRQSGRYCPGSQIWHGAQLDELM